LKTHSLKSNEAQLDRSDYNMSKNILFSLQKVILRFADQFNVPTWNNSREMDSRCRRTRSYLLHHNEEVTNMQADLQT
jgi:hypothetical protein